ncbi:hypothetical protein [Enterococcus faecium]
MNLTRDLIFLVLYLIGVFSILLGYSLSFIGENRRRILPCSFTAVRGHLR